MTWPAPDRERSATHRPLLSAVLLGLAAGSAASAQPAPVAPLDGFEAEAGPATSGGRPPAADVGDPELRAEVPSVAPDPPAEVADPGADLRGGLIAVLRIDGEGRGFAGGLGVAVARRCFEAELMVLRSDSTGGFLGVRYRFLAGWLRPYVGLGAPGFLYDQVDATGTSSTQLAIGVRGAAGIELRINAHLSATADVGYEHFFVDEMSRIDRDIFVPTLGVVAHL